MRVIFFGSSDYCIPLLESLHTHFTLVAIVTKPDRLVGRHHRPTPTAVKSIAKSHLIPVYTPSNKTQLVKLDQILRVLSADVGIVADYGLIIPLKILEIPLFKTLNIHFSRLPQLRGASPVQYTILMGEAKAWITLFIMEATMDTGPIVWQRQVPIANSETTGSLYKKLFEIASKDLPDILSQYASGKFKPISQDDSQATYTKMLSRDDGYIPWEIIHVAMTGKRLTKQQLHSWPLTKLLPHQLTINNYQLTIINALRAFSPWPGVWTTITMKQLNNESIAKRLKILQAHLESVNNQDTSGVASTSGLPRGGEIRLQLDSVQLEGKKPVSWKQFIEGHTVPFPDVQSYSTPSVEL